MCPDVLQLLHSLVLLVGGVTRGGWSGSLVIISSLCPVEPGFGCVGLGHVISFVKLVLQWGRMCSYRYHCRFMSRPGMVVSSGMVVFNASKESPFLRIVNSISGLSENSLTKTMPGLSADAQKQWYLEILGIGV